MPRLRASDWIPAAVLGGAALYEIWVAPIVEPGFPGAGLGATAMAVPMVAGVLLRRLMPLRALALVALSAGLQLAAIDDPEQYQPAFENFLALLLTAYSVVLHADRVRALQALVLLLAMNLAAAAWRPSRAALEDTAGMFVLLALVWAAASAVRGRQERIVELERDREREAAAAVADERRRIARELHDIIAHAVSVMVVQIGGARHAMRTQPDVAENSMQLAEAAGREALGEMRRLVGLMREEDSGTAPMPGIAALPGLAERFRRSGLPVTLDVDDAVADVAAGVDLTAYRVVQEGLTNVLKHAGPVPAAVRISHRGDRLEIDVRNGAGLSPRGNRSGHGLTGLRERVGLYGGRLEARPVDGGFALRVELPL